MAYRDLPTTNTIVCDVTSLTELHLLNGSIAEYSIPCNYVVPNSETGENDLVPIDLVAEGYSSPTLAIDPAYVGLTWYAWFDPAAVNIIKLVISAQCPDAVREDIECNVSLLITRTVEGLGERTDSVIRGPLKIEAAPVPGVGVPELPEQPVSTASRVNTVVTNFDGLLSATDTTVQAALETLDDHDHPHTHPVGELPAHTHTIDDLPPYPDPGNPVPTGAILPFGGVSAPSGWLLCDGSAVSRSTYAGLFAVILTAYGSGDGSSTFNVPNLKGRVPVGRDSADANFDNLGPNPTTYAGAKTHQLTTAQLPSHTHPLDTVGDNAVIFRNSGSRLGGITWDAGGAFHYDYLSDYNSLSAGSTQAHNNLQPYTVVNYIIKA